MLPIADAERDQAGLNKVANIFKHAAGSHETASLLGGGGRGSEGGRHGAGRGLVQRC